MKTTLSSMSFGSRNPHTSQKVTSLTSASRAPTIWRIRLSQSSTLRFLDSPEIENAHIFTFVSFFRHPLILISVQYYLQFLPHIGLLVDTCICMWVALKHMAWIPAGLLHFSKLGRPKLPGLSQRNGRSSMASVGTLMISVIKHDIVYLFLSYGAEHTLFVLYGPCWA